MSGPASVGPPGSGLPPPPYPGFSPSHSPASASAPGSVGAPHMPPSPGFYPPKPSPSGLLPSPYPHQSPHFASDQEEKQRIRFQAELEFVQCLGSPNYLNFLAQRGYFKDPTFVNYLKYLQYWKEPAYVKFLKYPVCLHFLELLQHESFRKEIVNAQVKSRGKPVCSAYLLFCFLSAQSSWMIKSFCIGNTTRGSAPNSWKQLCLEQPQVCQELRPLPLPKTCR